jgi:type IV pilus assembly protein PilB
MAKREKKPLGEGLVQAGQITNEQLKQVQEEGKKSGVSFKEAVVKLGFINEEELFAFIGEQLGVPYVDLTTYLIKPEIIKLVPEFLARKYKVVPILKIRNSLTVAMADPLNFYALDDVRLKTNCEVKSVISTEKGIIKAIEQYYGLTGDIEEVVKAIKKEELDKREEDLAEEAPVIKLVNLILMQAVREGASDVHIEPERDSLCTRFRVDGVLHEIEGPPKHLQSAVISRVKVLAKMDIAEKRRPQDGRFTIKMENKEIDLRVSTIPTHYGENLVMRILDKSSILLKLEDIGFSKEILGKYEELIKRPHGIILVTGPTGSGKTTTLYASLNKINSISKNIITIEDPIEYELEHIRQVQVNPRANVTFANALRSFLRQDPDVMMVGEIRDIETAEIAIQGALTGHLLFSTLHTNDAVSALMRLVDMEVEPFLVASSIIGIAAQRLVRVICPKCKETFEPGEEVLQGLGLKDKKEIKLYRSKGCQACRNTGYKGRLGIFELFILDDEVKEMVMAKASSGEIKKKAVERGMKTLRDDGLEKVLEGKTTLEEVLRVTEID